MSIHKYSDHFPQERWCTTENFYQNLTDHSQVKKKLLRGKKYTTHILKLATRSVNWIFQNIQIWMLSEMGLNIFRIYIFLILSKNLEIAKFQQFSCQNNYQMGYIKMVILERAYSQKAFGMFYIRLYLTERRKIG